MRPQVRPQHAVVGEPASTLQTDKPSPRLVVNAIVVAAHVLVQVAALSKGAVTLRADERSFAGVQSRVGLQVAALRKAAVTRVTDKRTVARVNTLVPPQVRRLHTQTRWRRGATGKAFGLAISRWRVQIRLEAMPRNNLRQVVYTYVPLSPSSITWYRPKGGDALRLGR